MRVCSHCGNLLHLLIYTYQYRDSIIKMRHFHIRLDFLIGILIPGRWSLYWKLSLDSRCFFFHFGEGCIFRAASAIDCLFVVWRVGETTSLEHAVGHSPSGCWIGGGQVGRKQIDGLMHLSYVFLALTHRDSDWLDNPPVYCDTIEE